MRKNISTKNKLENEPSDDKLEFFIDAVARFCDKCGTQYTKKDLYIVQDTNHSSIIHFTCSNCKSRHIATFLAPLGISSRTPVNTDLSVPEIGKFAQKKEIPADDVLDVYNLFNKKRSIKV